MDQAKLIFTGDLMCHPKQQIKAYDSESGTFDFKPSFKYVKKMIEEADFAVGNLETLITDHLPLSKDMRKLDDKPFLNSPKEFLDALSWAGFDLLVTANNHAADGDREGIMNTLDAVDRAGFLNTGSFRDKTETRYIVKEINGIKVGFLAYATYYNRRLSFKLMSPRRYMLNKTRIHRVKRDIAAIKAAGAEYIIAYNHCGTEYIQYPSERQIKFVNLLAECGVDHIIGSHPHVLQPFEYIKGSGGKQVPVMHSMGNFSTGMKDPVRRETILLRLTLTRDPSSGKVILSEQSYCPCFVMEEFRGEHYVIVPADKRYNDGFYSKQVPANFRHIREIVGEEHFSKW